VIQGTSTGAASDREGTFEIPSAPVGEQVVQASFVGYGTQEKTIQVQADQVTEVSFQLGADPLGLDQVVVTGTGGAVQKGKLGNTIATLDAGQLENSPVQSLSELLQGREPGVSGLPGGGMTGQGSEIRIRGSASLSQSNEPVVYVDGIRYNSNADIGGLVDPGGGGETSRLDDVNPASIDRVEILKGAAAATLYGSEASNGVIQIFTKQGDANSDTQFNFSVEQGISQFPTGRVRDQWGYGATDAQVQNMNEYARVDEETIRRFQVVGQNAVTDAFELGRLQTYTGSVQGGTDLITYYVGGRFKTQDGPLDSPPAISTNANDAVTRAQANVNVTVFPSDVSQIRVSTAYNQLSFDSYPNSNNVYAPVTMAYSSNPRDVNERFEYGQNTFASVEEAFQQSIEQEVERFTGSVNANYRPLEMLNLDATFGVDFTSNFGEEVRPYGWDVDGFTGFNADGQRQITNSQNLQVSLDTKSILSNEFGESFESTLTVGGQGYITRSTVSSQDGIGFPGPGFNVVDAAAQITPFETFQEVVQIGLFAQEQIGYKDFAYLTVGGRYDANSAFGSDLSGVFYPKVSGSVVVSDLEAWGASVGPVSTFRLRGAIGQSGLQPGAFDALTTFTSVVSDEAGVVANNLGNPDLQPEIATEWEVGTEIGVLQDRITFDGTYWNRTTSDALVQRQFPPAGGFRFPQLVNIGEVKGQGLELGLNATVVDGENLSIDVFANGAYLWERVTDLGQSPPIKAAGSYPRPRNYVVEGFAPGAHFGASLVEVEEGRLPVDLLDANGNLGGDGEPDSRDALANYFDGMSPSDLTTGDGLSGLADFPLTTDQVLLQGSANEDIGGNLDHYKGKPFPDWNGSFGFDASFLGNFSLSTMFEYKAGNYQVNNLSGAFAGRSPGLGRNTRGVATAGRNFVTGGVDANFEPQLDGETRVEALEAWVYDELGLAPFSGLNYIEDADFIRWRELSVTYDLPEEFVSQLGVTSASITLGGRNLKLWTPTGYSGIDPESNETSAGGGPDAFDQNFRKGIEAWQVPVQRRFTLKLDASF
jgi:TonB-linked SusC/RagA family outer membrane protein